MPLDAIRAEMAGLGIDGWLVASFRGSNPIFHDLSGIRAPLTRRAAIWLPREGPAVIFGSSVDGHSVRSDEHDVQHYGGLADFQARLAPLLAPCRRVAMEYTPDGANPVISRVDAGFVEWVRAQGPEVVSSGDLISVLVRWDAAQVADHRAAAAIVDRVRAEAFAMAFARVGGAQPITEHELAALILDRFAAAGLVDGGVDVATNAHAADPHYVPAAERPVPIKRGDLVLIDLWARMPGDRAPFADSTWMGFAGRDVPPEIADAFTAVRAARDAGLSLLQEAWGSGQALRGRDVDRYVRNVLAERGYTWAFSHRTGHSLGWHHTHGDGPNLDDFEFPDDRLLQPVSGLTIEPGVYLPGRFGVRLEISLLLTERGPEVTTARQEELSLPEA